MDYEVRANYVLDCTAIGVRLAMQIDHFYTNKHLEEDGWDAEDATVFMETRQSANFVSKRK